MKENDKLKGLTLEQLQRKRKWFNIIVLTLGIITVILLIEFCYAMFVKKASSYSTSLGVLGLPLILTGNYLQKIETEIKSRNSQS